MEFKTTEETKELIGLAASACGQDVTAFAIGVLAERARAVLDEMSTIRLTIEGHRRLAELLASPPEPTEEMKKLGALPSLPTRNRP